MKLNFLFMLVLLTALSAAFAEDGDNPTFMPPATVPLSENLDDDVLVAFLDSEKLADPVLPFETSDDNGEMGDKSQALSMTERSSKRKIWVVLAAQTTARLFHNHYYVGSVTKYSRKGVFPILVKSGDVIAITSSGNAKYRGVVALVKVGSKTYVTGKGGNFTTVVANSVGPKTHKQWAKPGFNACNWKKPVALKPQPQHQRKPNSRYAKLFPFKSGAKYVWAPKEKKGKTIYLRFVVDGDNCPTDRGVKRCACKQVRESTGQCYEFINPRFKETLLRHARCRRHDCAPKYECTQPGVHSKTLCVRRFAKTEVRSIGNLFKGVCKTVRIKPRAFYVPYAGMQ